MIHWGPSRPSDKGIVADGPHQQAVSPLPFQTAFPLPAAHTYPVLAGHRVVLEPIVIFELPGSAALEGTVDASTAEDAW